MCVFLGSLSCLFSCLGDMPCFPPHPASPRSTTRHDTTQLIDSLRLSLRPILLTRCGESEFEAQGRIGGNSRLTPVGHLYAEALARGLLQVCVSLNSTIICTTRSPPPCPCPLSPTPWGLCLSESGLMDAGWWGSGVQRRCCRVSHPKSSQRGLGSMLLPFLRSLFLPRVSSVLADSLGSQAVWHPSRRVDLDSVSCT